MPTPGSIIYTHTYSTTYESTFEIKIVYWLLACNIMAGEVSPIYNLINVGKRNNCTLTALYPAVVSIKNVNVGGTEQHLSYDVSGSFCS